MVLYTVHAPSNNSIDEHVTLPKPRQIRKKTLGKPRDFGGSPELLNDKSILITGGTGSFGRNFVKTVLRYGQPNRLVIFSRDEVKQYEMMQELNDENLNMEPVRFFLGDVRDESRLTMALSGIDTVVHAAALKQVPAAEYNPFECIKTNVIGAENLVQACIKSNVQKVIALSTDKACSPVNLYGASKLASDKIFIAANNLSGKNGCKFSVVRYGNVMGSRGSVIPLFQKLKSEGAEILPITNSEMTRFWITLKQSIDFVISCLDIMKSAELFVPKIPSIKITDLALAMAPDMKQKIIGIRPGEKLHEAMITEDDARSTIELTDRYIILPQALLSNKDIQEYNCRQNFVSERFKYTSDTNVEWLSHDEIPLWLNENIH